MYLIFNSAVHFDPERSVTDVSSVKLDFMEPCLTMLFTLNGKTLDAVPRNVQIIGKNGKFGESNRF